MSTSLLGPYRSNTLSFFLAKDLFQAFAKFPGTTFPSTLENNTKKLLYEFLVEKDISNSPCRRPGERRIRKRNKINKCQGEDEVWEWL
ncbi:hypothetical protein TNIN_272771 [Trichonephila inaurata madagascariensis]|uniref:Uncharacterized protein n=1 Tax=Trichonephila inaurata madagascariensis TaxID=2747483 RepID=A0A8X6Y324_9ARAC|nr:hypothetical protein TNIN_272771 [Trichonephila inaurata madagascariensis]